MDGGRAIPYLNAYASLKLLAQHRNTPLCGNRIWHSGSAIIAERAPGVSDTLNKSVPASSAYITQIQVPHGGRDVYYTTQPTNDLGSGSLIRGQRLHWTGTAWDTSTVSEFPENTTRNRWNGDAHDGLGGILGYPRWSHPEQPARTAGVYYKYVDTAGVQYENTISGTYDGLKSPAAYAMLPDGSGALVTVADQGGSTIYEVTSAGYSSKATLPNRIIYNLSYSESGDEIAIISGSMTQAVAWTDPTVPYFSALLKGSDCGVQFYSSDFANFSLRKSESLGDGCTTFYWNDGQGAGGGPHAVGEGTHAPLRIKGRQERGRSVRAVKPRN